MVLIAALSRRNTMLNCFLSIAFFQCVSRATVCPWNNRIRLRSRQQQLRTLYYSEVVYQSTTLLTVLSTFTETWSNHKVKFLIRWSFKSCLCNSSSLKWSISQTTYSVSLVLSLTCNQFSVIQVKLCVKCSTLPMFLLYTLTIHQAYSALKSNFLTNFF